jgi:hypothetical protein
MYEKTEWKARKGDNLNMFEKVQETAKFVVLANAPTAVTEPGTPFSAANMNHIEDGIKAAHDGITEEARARLLSEGALEGRLEERLAAKANLASPVFTGTPKMPDKTGAAGNDGTLIATEAQVAKKQDMIEAAAGSSYMLTAPAKVGGQPGARPLDHFMQAYGTVAQTIGGVKTFSEAPKVPGKSSAATAGGDTLIATEAQVALKANSVSGNANKVQYAASADHATTAGSANMRTAASASVIPNGDDSSRLATWADVYNTVCQMLSSSIVATGVTITGPQSLYYGGTVTYTAALSPAGALGVVDWSLSGFVAIEGNVWIEGATTGLSVVIETNRTGSDSSFIITASVRNKGITSSFNVNIRKPIGGK